MLDSIAMTVWWYYPTVLTSKQRVKKKQTHANFKFFGLRITVESTLAITDFLDVDLNLDDILYIPYKKDLMILYDFVGVHLTDYSIFEEIASLLKNRSCIGKIILHSKIHFLSSGNILKYFIIQCKRLVLIVLKIYFVLVEFIIYFVFSISSIY